MEQVAREKAGIFSAELLDSDMYAVSAITHIALLNEKDLRECRNLSVNFPCFDLFLSSGDFFVFSVIVSPF